MIRFDNDNSLSMLRKAIDKALIDTGKQHGVKFEATDVKYNQNNCTFKLEVSNIVGGVVETKELSDFRLYAHRYGLSPNHLGRTFTSGRGSEYEIVGLNTRGRKFPILCRKVGTTQDYKFEAKMILIYLGETTAPSKEEKIKERADAAVIDFKNYYWKYGLTQEHLGKTFTSKGRGGHANKFKIIGSNHRNFKYPIICENLVDGKRYKFAPRAIKRSLGETENVSKEIIQITSKDIGNADDILGVSNG